MNTGKYGLNKKTSHKLYASHSKSKLQILHTDTDNDNDKLNV